jgi:hypothetical protein
MIKRYKDQLLARLEQCVVTQGWCTIRHEELRHWYGQKITKTVWRDIHENLEVVCEEAGCEFKECDFAIYQYDGNIMITDRKDLEAINDLRSVEV